MTVQQGGLTLKIIKLLENDPGQAVKDLAR